ncbi:MAG: HNH endonuclease [Promicromonosporaceae bacterium]|nr:HNH endonuclease [Promicromonosporaceae bacterium]
MVVSVTTMTAIASEQFSTMTESVSTTVAAPPAPVDSLDSHVRALVAAAAGIARILSDERLYAGFDSPESTLSTLDPKSLLAAQSATRLVEGQLRASRLAMLPLIEAQGAWYDGNEGATFLRWLTVSENLSQGKAHREVRDANRLLNHLPATRKAAITGEINAGQLDALVSLVPTSGKRCAVVGAPMDFTQCDDFQFASHNGGLWLEETINAHQWDPDLPVPTGEEFLVQLATETTIKDFRGNLRRFARSVDPEADERGYEEAEEREYLELSHGLGGWDLRGFLCEENGQLLNTALTALTTPTTRVTVSRPTAGTDSAEGVDWESDEEEDARLNRTPAQKRAQALADLAHLMMNANLVGGGATERHQLVVEISYDALHRALTTTCNHKEPQNKVEELEFPELATFEPSSFGEEFFSPGRTGIGGGWFDKNLRPQTDSPRRFPTEIMKHQVPAGLAGLDPAQIIDPDQAPPTYLGSNRPIPVKDLRRLVCDCDIKRVVLGPDGQILDVGRTYRTAPTHIRTAVIARDKHCVFPGCEQPPERCEVHHALKHWADGGETSAANSALLCFWHHKTVDGQGITMTNSLNGPKPKGAKHQHLTWRFHLPNGKEILAAR